MTKLKTLFSLIISIALITACGGGGGGSSDSGGGYGNTNSPPNITNTNTNISVQENQTSAFTVSASDPDGDTLTYSISGNDVSQFTISSSGVVEFVNAPDFENPSDVNSDNIYEVTVTVSDSSLTDTANFMVTVTNDTSDDVTTDNYDGNLVMSGPIQSADICYVASISDMCSDAEFKTTTAQDGSFSLSVDTDESNGIIKSENGFDPISNWQIGAGEGAAIGQPITSQNFIISPISTMLYLYDNNTDYETLKTKLGINNDFMIRFDNPYTSLSSSESRKVASINTQLTVLYEVLKEIHTYETNGPEWITADKILNRTGDETSLGDTTFIKDLLSNLDSNFTPSSEQLTDLSAGISSFLQKIYADTNNAQSYFARIGVTELEDLMESVMSGTANSSELDKLIFNTIDWINENTSWDGGNINDNEEYLKTTTYSLSNEGSTNYIVDQINPKNTEFIIYVKDGDIIKFDPTSSVTSNHPFLLSTEVDDRDGSSEVGDSEGWDKNTLTLTVSANTPDELYPYCQFHAGMYTQGKIVKVTSYDVNNIDITNNSGALNVKGTVASGPFKGASGYTYRVYLDPQDASDHEHTFYEYPNLVFYMPNDQGYHGAENASSDQIFKPKSHYPSESSSSENDGY